MANIICDPTTCNDAVARYTVGKLYEFNGILYRYMQSLEALAAGVPCEYGDATLTGVYKAAHASAKGRKCAGVALLTTTINYYCFLQVTGSASIVTDGNVVAGDFIKCGTAAGVRDTSTLSYDFAFAPADDVSTTGTVYLNCL